MRKYERKYEKVLVGVVKVAAGAVVAAAAHISGLERLVALRGN